MNASVSGHPGLAVPEDSPEAPGTAAGLVPESWRLVGFSSDLGRISLDELDRRTRAVSRAAVRAWFEASPATLEASLLHTCHRVELYLLARSDRAVEEWRSRLPNPSEWTVREGAEAVHHLYRVAAGLESLARGEAEVRRQVQAAGWAVESRHRRPVLANLMQAAVESAERLTVDDTPPPSVAAVAAARVLELNPRPGARILVVGAGRVGRRVAELLAPSAQITVVYHQRPPDAEFVEKIGARSVPLDALEQEARSADVIITAIKAGRPCLKGDQLDPARPLLLVDLGVPRNIAPDVRALSQVRLLDLGELHARSRGPPTNGERDVEVARSAQEAADGLQRLLLVPWVDELWRGVEETRRAELESARPYLGALSPAQEAAVERLTRRLVQRLMVPAAQRLASLPAGPEGERQRRLALELLGPTLDLP